MTVFIGEMDWCRYQAKIADGTTPLFLPLGALEQHGLHLSMNVDVLLPNAMSKIVAEEIGGLVAPPLTYGYKSQIKSGGGNHMPGTTSVDGQTLTHLVRDILCEFARHGARRIILVNGHFENSMFIVEGIDLALRALRAWHCDGVRIMVVSYWDFIGSETIARLYSPGQFPGWEREHGGVLETSMMLYWHPELVNMDAVEDHAPVTFPPYDLFPTEPSWLSAAGTLSSPKAATREKGEILVSVCQVGICQAVRDVFGEQTGD